MVRVRVPVRVRARPLVRKRATKYGPVHQDDAYKFCLQVKSNPKGLGQLSRVETQTSNHDHFQVAFTNHPH